MPHMWQLLARAEAEAPSEDQLEALEKAKEKKNILCRIGLKRAKVLIQVA